MKRIKEFSIKLTEGNKFPVVEIDGEEISHITKLSIEYDSKNVMENPFEYGFLVEYFCEEDGSRFKRTIGQTFRIG